MNPLRTLGPFFKTEAAQEFIDRVQHIEDKCDTCSDELLLLKRPWNQSIWFSLTECIRRVEVGLPRSEYGSLKHRVNLINLSRTAAQLCRWGIEQGDKKPCSISRFRWFNIIGSEASTALEVGFNYAMFCTSFPAWHHSLYAVEIIGPNEVRFSLQASDPEHRISAHQKGILPNNAPKEKIAPMVERTQDMDELLMNIIRETKSSGVLGFRPPHQWKLYEVLAGIYIERLSNVFRRFPEIDVGNYNLEEFRLFYAGFLAMSGAQDYLCFRWAEEHPYPLESAVLVRPRTEWIKTIASLVGLDTELVAVMVHDLVFGRFRAQDLQLSPFVPVHKDESILAVAPPFVLASNWEENILRACSYVRPRVYSETTRTKEVEMRDQLKSRVSAPRIAIGPIKLLKHLPDIDLLIEEPSSDSILIAELKWLRKPYTLPERIQQNSQLMKGVRQVRDIRQFLQSEPDFLLKRKILGKTLSSYQHVDFCIVARDHLIYNDPSDCPIIDYDAFTQMLSSTLSLKDGMAKLRSLDWLPVENVNYRRDFRPFQAGGITTWMEIYSPI
jgi:hypothetical protein